MSFREKSAWLMALILIVAGANYLWQVVTLSSAIGFVVPPIPPLAVFYVVLIVIASIAGHLIIALISPSEANAPMDEREHLIVRRAGNWSGMLLGVGVLAGLIVFTFTGHGNLMFHVMVTSLLIAQIAEYLGQIWLYRRGHA